MSYLFILLNFLWCVVLANPHMSHLKASDYLIDLNSDLTMKQDIFFIILMYILLELHTLLLAMHNINAKIHNYILQLLLTIPAILTLRSATFRITYTLLTVSMTTQESLREREKESLPQDERKRGDHIASFSR